MICKKCGAESPDGSNVCMMCGEPFSGNRRCQKCGAIIEPQAVFCAKCGNRVSGLSSSAKNSTKGKKSGNRKTTRNVLIAASVAIAILWVIGLGGDGKSGNKSGTKASDAIKETYVSSDFSKAPSIIYTTPAEENGHGNELMYVEGMVEALFKSKGQNVCEISTKEGKIAIISTPILTQSGEWDKLKEGEWVRANFMYLGYSDVLEEASGSLVNVEEAIPPTDSESASVRGNPYIEATEIEKDNNFTEIDDFSYEISGNKVVLKRYVGAYSGDTTILEIKPEYEIEPVNYKSDISSFQVGGKTEALILEEGIEEVAHAIFNGSDVKVVFFPKSMKIVYDDTLAYLNPDEGEIVKIYYAGTQEEWDDIFTKYKRTPVGDAEFGYDMGVAAADWVNEKIGHGYDSSLFQFYFSADPSGLR